MTTGLNMVRVAVGCAVAVVLALARGAGSQPPPPPAPEADLRAAAGRALGLVLRAQEAWYENTGCASCHHQLIPAVGLSLAAARGVPVDRPAAEGMARKAFAHLTDADAAAQGFAYIDDVDEGWKLAAGHAAGVPPNPAAAAHARSLARAQRADGGWLTFDSRPPQSASPVTTTAVCARAVAAYLPDAARAERDAVLRKARDWLVRAEPRSTEDEAFRLLGLRWTGAGAADTAAAAARLRAGQRADGGWGQRPGLASDAYATGTALYALHEGGGVPAADPAVRRGLRFLLADQKPDGGWRVASRIRAPLRLSPEYFGTGFPPGGRDQYSSIAGTAWAAAALLAAVPPAAAPRPLYPDAAPAVPDWLAAALTETATDLERALAAGLDPNARTPAGTTVLMAAAADPAKVRLLLGRGADPAVRARSGFTALLAASRHPGNAEAVRLLAARAGGDREARTRELTTALFLAAPTGDTEAAGALLDAGATFDGRHVPTKGFFEAPLVSAVRRGDGAMAAVLLRRGADPNAEDDIKLTPLGAAVIADRAGMVRLLLTHKARVNHVDALGMTPLLYAATVDTTDPAVAGVLLAAGADRGARDAKGRTARELAEGYGHAAVAAALAR